ncbi:MAG: TetR family transcriptional regulator C-terminal domain-containing protein [Planctomycetota bacterium]
MTSTTPELRAKDTDTRERLLDAGAELFVRKGFHGCGLSEILKLASVPKGSFYHYFSSKEEFGVVLIERTFDAYVAELRPLLANRKMGPRLRLRAIFEWCRNECAASGPKVECLITKLALETSQLSEPLRAAVKCAYQQWAAILAQVIREGQAANEIDSERDPDRLSNVMVMTWEGAVMRMQIDRNIDPLDDFLLFFDAIVPATR